MQERYNKQQEWNKPIVWPLVLIVLILLFSIWPLTNAYKKRQRSVLSSKPQSDNHTQKGGV